MFAYMQKNAYLCTITMDNHLHNDMHHCIFEIHKEAKRHKFVADFGDNYSDAEEFCQSMNNFRTPTMPVYFCVRLLDQEEFENISNYNPFLTGLVVKLPPLN